MRVDSNGALPSINVSAIDGGGPGLSTMDADVTGLQEGVVERPSVTEPSRVSMPRRQTEVAETKPAWTGSLVSACRGGRG